MPTPPPSPAPDATADSSAAGTRSTGSQGFYRYDLDGLRGVAIALVAAFHIWFGRVSGGVDVFLALSGFFFGGKIIRAALNPAVTLSPVAEVIRLIRRLVPALVVVLAGCAVLTILVQPETRWETFADQSLASLGYYQNWELANTASDYLRAGEAVSPLQHIWSMSVQGQFYVSFLLLIAGLALLFRRPPRLRPALVGVLTALTVASFVYAIIAHQQDQAAAYYNSFARGWELLLGALVGALVGRIRWPMWLRTMLATVALVAVLSCGALIDGVHEFPGPWALVPVGAAMLMILVGANLQGGGAGGRLPLPNRLLATRPLVELGAMAYALYLWHWPLLIFWLSYSGHKHAGVVEGAVLLLVSGVLAYLTNRLVEDPLRYRASSKPAAAPAPTIPWATRLARPTMALGSAIVLLGVTLTATSFTWRQHVTVLRSAGKELSVLNPQDYPGARALTEHVRVPALPMRPTVLEVKQDLPASTRDGCISDFVNPAVVTCTYGDIAADRTIALAGGSHAEHWLPALDILGKLHHFKVVTYLKMGCPLSTEQVPLIMGNNAPYPQCREWVQRTMTKLVTDRPDYVFTTTTRPWNIKSGDVMPATYIGIWQTLSDNNIPVLGMRDTPWLVKNGQPFDPADCLAKRNGTPQSCAIKRSDMLSDRNQTLDFVAQFPQLKVLDMSDAICRADVCRPVEGNILIYHGAHHLSPTYVRTMAPELGRQIAEATGWW
ncbi:MULTISPECIES: acyltransferase family protein [Mycobacterium]|uniref:Acyltransferase n=1 Tax=Mycobacterium colombiense TaxID=339268 RepID=A0A329LTR1_9MYCO|nr:MULTISPECIES: acyltransferase family protein [Mycobacterium]MDM4142299.1 acyltransferase family protein [Mycobacterium sp. FLAC0960]RAV10532.1 acyltransferase [Mycobacterium colombiense]